jgi:hypothetical protein
MITLSLLPLKRWAGAIFLLSGVPLFIAGIVLSYNDWTFAREARSTQGTVIEKTLRTTGTGSSARRTKHYEIRYRFTVDGKTVDGRDELFHDKWEALDEGSAVEVLYRPANPESSRTAGSDQNKTHVALSAAGLVATLLGGFFLFHAIRSGRLASRLQQTGVHTKGTVTRIHSRRLTINEVALWRVHYEYSDFQGRRYEQTVDMAEGEAKQWKVGDFADVLYDPAQPAQASWIGSRN